MVIKPSRLRAFLITFIACNIFVLLFDLLAYYFPSYKSSYIKLIFLHLFFSTLVSLIIIFFRTPDEIEWTDERFIIRTLISGTGNFSWQDLECYSASKFFGSKFCICFVAPDANKNWIHKYYYYDIPKYGFCRSDWENFQNMLHTRFPNKKRMFFY